MTNRFIFPLRTNSSFNLTQVIIPYLDSENVGKKRTDKWTSISNSFSYAIERFKLNIGVGFDFTSNGENSNPLIKLYGFKLNAGWDIVESLVLNFNFSTRYNNTITKIYNDIEEKDELLNEWKTSSSGINLALGYRF